MNTYTVHTTAANSKLSFFLSIQYVGHLYIKNNINTSLSWKLPPFTNVYQYIYTNQTNAKQISHS